MENKMKCASCGSDKIVIYRLGYSEPPVYRCTVCGKTGFTENIINPKKSDVVNHPSHYAGKIECIDYIRDKLTPEGFTEYCIGNVLKYVSRWRKKDGIHDLKKAAVYLNWAIESAAKEEAFADKDAAQRGDQDVLAPAT